MFNVVDIDECESDPCLNSGNCTDLISGFECSCANEWTGVHCQGMTISNCLIIVKIPSLLL